MNTAPDPVQARLLIVDDDLLLRGIAARTLQHAGFDVSVADSGEAALPCFAQHAHDLVLLDVMMPGLDGYEVCQRIRAMPRGARVPILMLTGLNDTGSIDLAYRHGATDFITKPINWTLLAHRVRYALRASSAAEAMRRSRESLARAQRLAGMGNWVVLADGRMEASAELLRLCSGDTWPGSEPVPLATLAAFQAHVAAADLEPVQQARDQLRRHGTAYQLEYRIVCADGSQRSVFEQATPLRDEQGQALGIEGITQDITASVQARERIRQLAHYDNVTGLPNRQFFADLAAPTLERARRHVSTCALLHVDIDRFKGINDAFGRLRGDAVLQTVAQRLRAWIRGSDLAASSGAPAEAGVLARVGGNAFTLLIGDLAGQAQASAVALRLLDAIAQPIEVEAQSLVLTASVGVALFPADAQDLAGLTRCAEQAAYAAKSAGRAQHQFFCAITNAQAAGRLMLEVDLRRGIAQGELRLHFQPQVDANDGRIVGAEALVRWQHPVRGLVPPADFIPLAEDSGLIVPLTDWVLEAACAQLRAWRDAGLPALTLSVNLAATTLADPALTARLDGLMQRHRLAPADLKLEVTETMLMHDVDSAVERLQALRARGHRLSLDDFGTGYSSLSYLKRFPIDELKIDRAFVTDASRGGRDGALAAAIIVLGREFGLGVVAEGVETPQQQAFLLHHGCHVHQGYLYARPLPAAAFEQMLRADNAQR